VVKGKEIVYVPEQDLFVKRGKDYLDWGLTEEYLQNLIASLAKDSFGGVEFSFLFERPGKRGADFDIASLMVAACYALFDKQGLEKIRQLSAVKHKGSDNEMRSFFDALVSQSSSLIARSHYGFFPKCAAFSSSLKSKSPFVSFIEETGGTVEKRLFEHYPMDSQGEFKQVDSIKRWGFSLAELTGKKDQYFPIDVTSVHLDFAEAYRTATESVQEVVVPGFDSLRDQLEKIFEGKIDLSQKRLPSFLSKMGVDGILWQRYAKGQSYTLAAMITKVIQLYKNKTSTVAAIDFLHGLDAIQNISAPFEEASSNHAQIIASRIKERAREVNETVAVHIYGWGKKNTNLYVFSHSERFRKEIIQLVQELQKEMKNAIHIDFASWRDGWGSEGLKVHQCLSKSVYSEFVKPGTKELVRWTIEGELHRGAVSKVTAKEFDLFLDTTKGKIFIGGKAVTSKEIPSQKASLKILEVLMDRMGESVGNENLPVRTYSGYRNELQGKIVGPLDKVLRERLDKELGVAIHGKLTGYTVRWDPKEITIGLLREI